MCFGPHAMAAHRWHVFLFSSFPGNRVAFIVTLVTCIGDIGDSNGRAAEHAPPALRLRMTKTVRKFYNLTRRSSSSLDRATVQIRT